MTLLATSGQVVAQQAGGGRPPDEILLLDISINGQDQSETRPVLKRDGGLFVRMSDLKSWRIKVPAGLGAPVDGVDYAPLASLPGVAADIDTARQMLRLTIPPDDFETTVLTTSAGRERAPLTTPVRAAFASYDVSLERDGSQTTATAFLQTGISDSWGLITNTMVLGHGADVPAAVRLDTYYLYDNPDRLTRTTIGDATTLGADWVQPIRYAGVRYGTEFDLQPNLVTFPTPTFFGRTSLPSSVELYVNNALQFQGNVDPGPFSLNQAPLITGAGQVTLMVHDALGVEQQVTTSYYVSSGLLRPGLRDFSIEAGAERADYGVQSFDYRDPFVAGTYRQGFNDNLTGESRVELGSRVQDVGGGAVALWPALGEFGLAVAASNSNAGAGGLVRASFNRLTPHWNVSVIYQHATSGFEQIGMDGGAEQIRDQLQASGGVSFKRLGSFGVSYTSLTLGDQGPVRITSVNYGLPIGRRAFLNLFLLGSAAQGQKSSTTLGFGLTVPFGQRSSLYVQGARRDNDAEFRVTPPTDQGWGYRLAATQSVQTQTEADLIYRSQAGEFTAEAAREGGVDAFRFLADGGLVMIGGKVSPTRQLDTGFGIVEAPDSPNVKIYQENRLIARTDANGQAILTDLRPYDRNKISLDPGDLPLETELASDVLQVTPRYFGAVLARFDIKRERPATIVVRLENGQLLDAGTPVTVDGATSKTFAGYDGEVFVTTIHPGMVLRIAPPSGACQVVVATVPKGLLPHIGPLVCQTVGAGK
ncbi:MAG: fimbria/pilus outer membrane usher protein [Caulobacteraceae bacterium]